MFELADARYIEGAPMEWRRWLTPGTPILVEISDHGVKMTAAAGGGQVPWESVAELEVRGPDEPDVRWEDQRQTSAADAIADFRREPIRRGRKSKFCWLAIKLKPDGEIIVSVDGLVRHELQRMLVEHSE